MKVTKDTTYEELLASWEYQTLEEFWKSVKQIFAKWSNELRKKLKKVSYKKEEISQLEYV
jgi:hypothetical protein